MKIPRATPDAALTDALAEVIGYLRVGPYARLREQLKRAVAGASDEFVRRLADHLRDEEFILFPALRSVAPGASAALEAGEREHEQLRGRARELAARIVEGEEAAALETARVLLAELFEHMRREEVAVDGIVDALDEDGLRGLAALLSERRARAAAEDLRPLFAEWEASVEIESVEDGVVRAVIRSPEMAAMDLRRLRTGLVERLRERVPDVRRVEVRHEDSCCRR